MNYKRLYFFILFSVVKLPSCQGLVDSTRNSKQNYSKFHSVNTQSSTSKLWNTTQKSIIFSITSDFKSNKKWQIERVTNKQYGIINILWQKTKIFIDMDYSNFTCKATTVAITPEDQDTSVSIKKLQTSTPSYIEFYYLDYTNENKKHKDFPDFILQKHKYGENKLNADRSKKGRASAPSLLKIRGRVPRKDQPISFEQFKSIHLFGPSDTKLARANKSTPVNHVNKAVAIIDAKPKFKKDQQSKNYSLISTNDTMNNRTKSKVTKSSTAYDKVKFFELYDSNTPQAYKLNTQINLNTPITIYDTDKEFSSSSANAPILLQHVDDEIGHQHEGNKTRYVKKHVQNFTGEEKRALNEIDALSYLKRQDLNKSSERQENASTQRHSQSNGSRLATLSEFPFVAAYIYEPSQVRCDAASISPHWLLAAASCLSRHRRELHGGRLTAFVAFCSHNWREPHRVSYVKRTLIHPRYHPRDRTRRCLYNAGVIQIVNSMADTCSGWAPVSLMSHHFTADQEGTIATAVGWGLDRYDKLYTISDFQRHSLMLYENQLYTRSCPGNLEYSDAKATDEDGTKNVYCLSLPPYVAEESDAVHGALLLIGGKLLALYLQIAGYEWWRDVVPTFSGTIFETPTKSGGALSWIGKTTVCSGSSKMSSIFKPLKFVIQEERRPWGVQSAQYTGVWKLEPWLTETAREPDDYLFQVDI